MKHSSRAYKSAGAAVLQLLSLGCGASSTANASAPAGAHPTAAAPSAARSTAKRRPNNIGVGMPPLRLCELDDAGQPLHPIAPGRYHGLLRTARCEQQKFLVMARVAEALGVGCEHCHVPDPHNPKKYFYDQPTPNKTEANWMEATFIRGLAQKDGAPMRCASCHRDAAGQPSITMLGAPRDVAQAQLWMYQVMTARFTQRNGDRLRCRTCHIGNAPTQPGWTTDVVSAITVGPEGLSRK